MKQWERISKGALPVRNKAKRWLCYSGLVFVDVLPRLRDRAPVTYNIVFVVSLFLSSLAMHWFCRRIWSRSTPWPRAIAPAGLMSIILGFPCGILAEWSWNIAPGNTVTSQLFFSAWGDMIYATFVLIAWSALYLGIKNYEALEAERERSLQAETLAREARLQALRYQLNPHFLFNTLNAISTLVSRGDGEAASQMLLRLAAFLRVTLDGSERHEIPLSQEIFNTHQYLDIEKARLGDRLALDLSVSPFSTTGFK